MKNKARLSTLALAILGLTITGCDNDGPVVDEEPIIDNITNISLDRYCASMFYSDKADDSFNEEIQLKANVLPKKAGARKISWKSSDANVATVDSNGTVKAISEGTAEIICYYDDNEEINASTHIVVNNMNGVKISHCNTRLDDIIATQNKSSFVVPDVVTSYETFDQIIEKNGVVVSKTHFTQAITSSKENAFVQLDIDETDWKCEGGSPEKLSLQYVFYTSDQYETYLFKTQGLTNTYMKVNQSDFIGKGRLNALEAVCENFFRGGASIIEDNYEDILMQSAKGWLSSVEANKHYGRMSSVPGQLAFDVNDTFVYTATSADEDDMNIPVGTRYSLDVYDRVLYENFYCTSKYIEQVATYKIGDDTYTNSAIVDYYYKANSEIEIPNKDNYSIVDSISNL